MIASGQLELGNILHMECLWFCFEQILSLELDAIKMHWNTHRIRQTRLHGTVSGIPNVMYYLPERFGAIECKCPLRIEQIEEVKQYVEVGNLISETSENIQEYFNYVMEKERYSFSYKCG